MKLRNQILALFCLALFVTFGVFYVRFWVVQKPFGIVLFVSDGMVVRHLTAARLYQSGGEQKLGVESFPNLALVTNSSRDFSVPDAASAATALATGVKVNHRNVAVTPEGKPLKTLLEIARSEGRSVGLVTNGQLSDPTPGSFYAHIPDSRDSDKIAQTLVETAHLNVILGGGASDFTPLKAGGRRKDQRDLVAEMSKQGRDVVTTKAALENADTFRTRPLVGLFSPGPMAYSNQPESGSQQPSLSDMVRRAVEVLQTNRKGYLLVVDAALCSRATEENLGEITLVETLAMDQAISTAVKQAGPKSLVVAVGKHATGGLSLNGYPPRKDRGFALLGTASAGYPYLAWTTGPHGPAAKNEPSAFQISPALNTAEDMVAAGNGVGAERIRGFMDNTQIFAVLKEAL
jgi:alkaline phosphatase